MPSTDINGRTIVILSESEAKRIYQILKDEISLTASVLNDDTEIREIMHKIERDLKL